MTILKEKDEENISCLQLLIREPYQGNLNRIETFLSHSSKCVLLPIIFSNFSIISNFYLSVATKYDRTHYMLLNLKKMFLAKMTIKLKNLIYSLILIKLERC